ITDLGKLPIDNVTLNSDGMAYLVGFQPRTDGASAVAIDEQLRKGISENGHVYGRAAKVELDHTYALRSIAYRGKVMRSVQGASYNELDFDRRRDVIFAFRVVAMEADGSVTVVWTELQNLESPKLKIEHSETSSKE